MGVGIGDTTEDWGVGGGGGGNTGLITGYIGSGCIPITLLNLDMFGAEGMILLLEDVSVLSLLGWDRFLAWDKLII